MGSGEDLLEAWLLHRALGAKAGVWMPTLERAAVLATEPKPCDCELAVDLVDLGDGGWDDESEEVEEGGDVEGVGATGGEGGWDDDG